MTYDLSQTYGGDPGKKYDLRLRVKLAAGEGGAR